MHQFDAKKWIYNAISRGGGGGGGSEILNQIFCNINSYFYYYFVYYLIILNFDCFTEKFQYVNLNMKHFCHSCMCLDILSTWQRCIM